MRSADRHGRTDECAAGTVVRRVRFRKSEYWHSGPNAPNPTALQWKWTKLCSRAGRAIQTQTGDQENEDDAAQQAQLAARAKITEAEAITAAQAAYPGSTVTVKGLDGENGSVFYELKVQPADGSKAFEAAESDD